MRNAIRKPSRISVRVPEFANAITLLPMIPEEITNALSRLASSASKLA